MLLQPRHRMHEGHKAKQGQRQMQLAAFASSNGPVPFLARSINYVTLQGIRT